MLGLNPHRETTYKFSEEERILVPAINALKSNKIRIYGPFPTRYLFPKSLITLSIRLSYRDVSRSSIDPN